MKSQTGIIICGFMGKMGQSIARSIEENDQTFLAGATVRPSEPTLGLSLEAFSEDAHPKLQLHSTLDDAILDAKSLFKSNLIVLDFSSAAACVENAQTAAENNLPYLVGTSALKEKQINTLQKLSVDLPILVAPNTSIGANLLAQLAKFAARALPDADIEIAEIHHRNKRDSPSGTALFLGQELAKAREVDSSVIKLDRSLLGQRKKGEIGIVGLRGGSEKGEHSVYFFLDNERIELKHQIFDRSVFANGAIKAAIFLGSQKAGLYNMSDVLESFILLK